MGLNNPRPVRAEWRAALTGRGIPHSAPPGPPGRAVTWRAFSPVTPPASFPRQVFRGRAFLDELERCIDENGPGAFAQACPGHVIVALEASIIFAGQNVAEGIIGQAEEKVVPAAHLALQVIADVG